jgi:hypothetical protein
MGKGPHHATAREVLRVGDETCTVRFVLGQEEVAGQRRSG